MVLVACALDDMLMPTPPPRQITVNLDKDWIITLDIRHNGGLAGRTFSLVCPLCNRGGRKMYANALTRSVGCRHCLKLTWMGMGRRAKAIADSVYREELQRTLHTMQRGVSARLTTENAP